MRLLLFGLLFSLTTCQTEQQQRTGAASRQPTKPAFYHWKGTFALTDSEQTLLQKTATQTLYVRFFDVDWDEATRQPVPKSEVRFRQKPMAKTIIPVVFITNRTLLNLSPNNVPELARRLVAKVKQLATRQQLTYPELQLDCDWTGSTRTHYFALLKAIAAQTNVPLSATIRLHQVKYVARTGVPPVRRGMLMAYNMADWRAPNTRNSILDLDELRRYVDYLPGYSLPLDVALPLFRWAVLFRNGRVLALRTNLTAAQVRGQSFLTPQIDSTRFTISRDTTVWGVSLRRGDQVRTEACPLANLVAAKAMIFAKLPDQKRTFTLYHLDSTTLSPYTHAALNRLLHHVPDQTP